MIVGTAAVVAAIAGLVLLAALQIRDEASPRRDPESGAGSGSAGGGGFGPGGGMMEELHALFSSGKQVQIEQRREQLVLRDDEHAGAPPNFGVDLEAGVAVLPGTPATPGRPTAPGDTFGGPSGQPPQVREQSTSR
ncbi:DUF6191 domain-containing protein [Streptomyces sp. SP17BM10]|uniref:DUF6191 domain-containing protein n=1 Tax=Streptomyces sp. SP17BM10 TaxID=3002530 RepID=UPI002E7682E5|nr:DUF6191 domain-containing protein [Streptomyces sp. SP17BM10]MEE1787499.1 DUF6191 domain-containing protein [Streptomyces sp. SP17BM10]